jgi:hypothetical protein
MSEPSEKLPFLGELPTERIVLSEEDKAFFLKEGYLVVKGVFNAEEIALYNRLFMDYYEWISKKKSSPEGFRHADKSTYKRKNLVTGLHGILKNYAVGHCKALWAIRSHPRLRHLFHDLIGATVCSLDGAGFIPDVDVLPRQPEKNWLHVDKDPRIAKGKLAGIQAVVVGAGTEHTRVIPGSHLKDFSHLIPEGAPASHWFKPDPKDDIFRKEDSIVIHAKPGDVILFMEGLVHSGTQPTKGERMVYYVTGVTNLTKKMRINYEKWVKWFRTTGHSLYKANAENPQHYGDSDLMPENHFAFAEKFRQNIDELKDDLSAEHFASLVQLREDPWNPTLFDLTQKPIFETVSLSEETKLFQAAERKRKAEERKRKASSSSASASGKEPELKRQRTLDSFGKKEE